MLYLRPSLLLLLILSVLIFSCDPDEAKKKPPETINDQDQNQDDNNDNNNQPVAPPEQPTSKPPAPIASLGAISDNAKKDASNTGWVFQGDKITFSTIAKDKDGNKIPAAQFIWQWRKRGKDWKKLSSPTKTVTIPIKTNERVGAYELQVSAESGGQRRDNNEKLYEFTVRKKEGCPAPNTKNAPANLAALKAMVTGSSPSVTGEDLKAIDTSKVKSLYQLFKDDRSFNGKINCWDVSNVTTMERTFDLAIRFDQNIGDWDVSNVTDMTNMFDTNDFNNGGNASIGNWDVSKVTTMVAMFSYSSFNQDIGDWDVSSVTNMTTMFKDANKFNQDLSRWVTKQVEEGRCFGFASGASVWQDDYKPKFKISC